MKRRPLWKSNKKKEKKNAWGTPAREHLRRNGTVPPSRCHLVFRDRTEKPRGSPSRSSQRKWMTHQSGYLTFLLLLHICFFSFTRNPSSGAILSAKLRSALRDSSHNGLFTKMELLCSATKVSLCQQYPIVIERRINIDMKRPCSSKGRFNIAKRMGILKMKFQSSVNLLNVNKKNEG